MWPSLGCAPANPDQLLRAGEPQAAAEAWAQAHGERVDVAHPAAEAIVRRAPFDATVTMEEVAETMRAVALLERAPSTRTQDLDLVLEDLAGYAACTARSLGGPWMVAIGRSATAADRDPVDGGALPYRDGRVVGWASNETDLTTMLAGLDRNPPVRRVTISMVAGGPPLHVFLEHRDASWATLAASDATAAANWITGCPRTPR